MTYARSEDGVDRVQSDSNSALNRAMVSAHERLTPAAYGRIAMIVRSVRNGALSAQRARDDVSASHADATRSAHARGYALGWSAAATLVALTAADAGAQLANDDPD